MPMRKFQNSSVPKWIVYGVVGGVRETKYFPRTRAGRKAAVAAHEDLIKRQDALRQPGSGLRNHRERACKEFKTGVVNVYLYWPSPETTPVFKLNILLNKDYYPVTASRSIDHHGYDEAWYQVMDVLNSVRPLKKIPPPPCRKLAKKHLRAQGATKDLLRF